METARTSSRQKSGAVGEQAELCRPRVMDAGAAPWNRGNPVIRLALPADWKAGPPIEPGEVNAIRAEAERLGVWPAVARNLFGDGDEHVRAVAARNLLLAKEQSRLLGLLADAGVKAHVVKGVALVERLYPDLSWREIGDIDLLVSPRDARRAFEVLRSAGAVPNRDWNPSGLARVLGRSLVLAPELVFTTPTGLMVELHWDWPGDTFPSKDLFEAPESYLVYLCRHAGKHFWSCLKWSCDIELFLRRFGPGMDWALFWRVARRAGAELSCAVSFELCRRWFGQPVMPGSEMGRSRKTQRLAEKVAAEALNPSASPSHPIWIQYRLAAWRHRPILLRTWLSPQPREWNHAGRQGWSAWRVWTERGKHLWAQWAPHRVRRLSAGDWFILFEAGLTLAVVETARRLLPVRWLLPADGDTRKRRDSKPAGWSHDKLQRVAWLVDVAANRQPVAMQCLTRSLALVWILKRRGVDAELRIGVKKESSGVQAHAWVEWQGRTLNDPMNQAGDYVPLATAAAFDGARKGGF